MSVFLVDYSDFKDWIKANNYEEKEYDLDQESDGKHGTNVFWHIKKKDEELYASVSAYDTHGNGYVDYEVTEGFERVVTEKVQKIVSYKKK